MKIRSGFVSNSSSSSFIIAADGPPSTTVTIDIPYEYEISTKEDLLVRFKDHFCITDEDLFEEEYAKQYNQCVVAIESGKKIYFGSVSSDSGEAENMYLYNQGSIACVDDPTAIVIQDI